MTWPLSLSSTLSIDVDDLFLAFSLTQTEATNLDSSVDSLATETDDHESRVAEAGMLSVAVASEFVTEELSTDEDAELRESLHLDPSTSDANALPGAFAFSQKADLDVGKDEEVTMLAGIIERLISRLSFRVRRIRVKLLFESEAGGESEMEFRLEEVRYVDETGANQESSTNRVFRMTLPSLHLRTPTVAKQDLSQSIDSVSSSDSSSAADMMMSQSIADLRSSTASMYASATGDLDSVDEDVASEDESMAPPAPSDGYCQICNFGNEEIVLSVVTTRVVNVPDTPRKESTIRFALVFPQPVTLLFLPQHSRLLLEMAENVKSPTTNPALPSPPSLKSIASGTVTLHGFNCIVGYEETPTNILSSLPPSFWQHPQPQHLPTSHLRLRLDSISLAIDATSTKTLTIGSFAITEHLRSINGTRTLPILISDPKMVQQSSGLSSFESADWIMDKTGEARGWRTKQARIRRGPSIEAQPDSPSITLRLSTRGSESFLQQFRE